MALEQYRPIMCRHGVIFTSIKVVKSDFWEIFRRGGNGREHRFGFGPDGNSGFFLTHDWTRMRYPRNLAFTAVFRDCSPDDSQSLGSRNAVSSSTLIRPSESLCGVKADKVPLTFATSAPSQQQVCIGLEPHVVFAHNEPLRYDPHVFYWVLSPPNQRDI